MVDVSIVIVCMNNVKQLFPCLDSIKKYTSVTHEVFVVAYLFTPENLKLLRETYPDVKVIESNEIRGFSENNNLALRQAEGRYCFVVNDDTELRMNTIDCLVKTIDGLPDDVAVISPNIIYPDGRAQCCGRPPFTWRHWVANKLHLWKESDDRKYSNKSGVFQSYNISGAAFLIRTDVFREFGLFDERFFFCPEDIALSTSVNKKGYKCYVDADAYLVHDGGMSGKSFSMTQTATLPAAVKGMLLYYSAGNKLALYALSVVMFVVIGINCVYHYVSGRLKDKPNKNMIYSIAELNTLRVIFKKSTPKEVFIHYYNKKR